LRFYIHVLHICLKMQSKVTSKEKPRNFHQPDSLNLVQEKRRQMECCVISHRRDRMLAQFKLVVYECTRDIPIKLYFHQEHFPFSRRDEHSHHTALKRRAARQNHTLSEHLQFNEMTFFSQVDVKHNLGGTLSLRIKCLCIRSRLSKSHRFILKLDKEDCWKNPRLTKKNP
jgi:hypothetical protein